MRETAILASGIIECASPWEVSGHRTSILPERTFYRGTRGHFVSARPFARSPRHTRVTNGVTAAHAFFETRFGRGFDAT